MISVPFTFKVCASLLLFSVLTMWQCRRLLDILVISDSNLMVFNYKLKWCTLLGQKFLDIWPWHLYSMCLMKGSWFPLYFHTVHTWALVKLGNESWAVVSFTVHPAERCSLELRSSLCAGHSSSSCFNHGLHGARFVHSGTVMLEHAWVS